MTDPMPCPSCGASTCPAFTDPVLANAFGQGGRCCQSCTGNHENATYEQYYPEPTKETQA